VFGFVLHGLRLVFRFCFRVFSISTVNGFPVCLFYGQFSGFGFSGFTACFPVLVPGFSIVSISGVGSWILFYGLFSALFSGFTACFLFGLAVSACHRDG